MPQFVISYIGGDQPASPEEGKEHMGRYMAWIKGLGAKAVSPMNPFGKTHTVKPSGDVEKGSSIGMSGYTIVEAESIEEAIEMAKACPFLDINGSLEVSELMQMPNS